LLWIKKWFEISATIAGGFASPSVPRAWYMSNFFLATYCNNLTRLFVVLEVVYRKW
jgi:hypothetical protein